MPAVVPFKGAVCATLCKPTVQGADVISYRSHDSVFRALFLVAKAQINALCLYQVLLREGSFSPLALRTLSAFPREMLCAMTLQSIL